MVQEVLIQLIEGAARWLLKARDLRRLVVQQHRTGPIVLESQNPDLKPIKGCGLAWKGLFPPVSRRLLLNTDLVGENLALVLQVRLQCSTCGLF